MSIVISAIALVVSLVSIVWQISNDRQLRRISLIEKRREVLLALMNQKELMHSMADRLASCVGHVSGELEYRVVRAQARITTMAETIERFAQSVREKEVQGLGFERRARIWIENVLSDAILTLEAAKAMNSDVEKLIESLAAENREGAPHL